MSDAQTESLDVAYQLHIIVNVNKGITVIIDKYFDDYSLPSIVIP